MQAIDMRLDQWKSELLDLTRRNRMLNYRVASPSTLSILEPGFDEMYARMSADGAALSFRRPLDRATDARVYSVLALMESLGEPLDVEVGDIRTAGTLLERQRVLLNLRQKARLAMEEQGAGILYLSFGFLHWRDGEGAQSAWRMAPLVLMPVSITQASVGAPFMLERREEEVVLNPTLDYLLRTSYGLELPPFDGDAALDEYLQGVEKVVAARGWDVVRTVSLGLLSFLKLSMYQDMERNREQIRNHPIIRALAGAPAELKPFCEVEPGFHDAQEPLECFQVVGADSSQQDAIELSRRGTSFIMQGPPGTGKSQTITNIISQALADGRRVLFVAEKMAALQVVYRKLQDAGLSDFCLPIHSHKANKRDVLRELGRMLELDQRQVKREALSQLDQLKRLRGELGAYATQLHAEAAPLGMSAYDALGELAGLCDMPDMAFAIDDAPALTRAELEARAELARVYGIMRSRAGAGNPFAGVTEAAAGERRAALIEVLGAAARELTPLAGHMAGLRARGLERAPIGDIEALRQALEAAAGIQALPALWREGGYTGARLSELAAGLRADEQEYARGTADMAALCGEAALDADWDALGALREVGRRLTGAYPRTPQELAAPYLEENVRALRTRMDELTGRARACCRLTGAQDGDSLAAAQARAGELDMLIEALALPDECVLATPEALLEELGPLEALLSERAQLLTALGGGTADPAAPDRLRALEALSDVAQAARKAGLTADPEGLERLALMAGAARDEYARMCAEVLAAARAARMDEQLASEAALDRALKACQVLCGLSSVPACWANAAVRAQLGTLAGQLRARERALRDERAALDADFTPRAFEMDIEPLLERFNAGRSSLLRAFRPAYRADRQQVRECFRAPYRSDDELAHELTRVVSYRARLGELRALVQANAAALGRHLGPAGVDWDGLERELKSFDALCALLGDAQALGAAQQPDRAPVAALRTAILALIGGVGAIRSIGIDIAPGAGAAGESACLELSRRARELSELIATACAELGAARPTYEAARELLSRAARLSEVEDRLATPGAGLRALLGGRLPKPDEWPALARRMAALAALEGAQGGHLNMRTREVLLNPHGEQFVRDALRVGADDAPRIGNGDTPRTGADDAPRTIDAEALARSIAEEGARLTGHEPDMDAPAGALRAELDELLALREAGIKALAQASAALRPGADARALIDLAPDLGRLRATRTRLREGEGARVLGALRSGEGFDWEYVDNCIDLWERARKLAERAPGYAPLILGACGRGAGDALYSRALTTLAAAARAREALAAVADCFEYDLLSRDADELEARLERCAAAPERLDAQLELLRARRECTRAGMADFVAALDALYEAEARREEGDADAACAADADDAHDVHSDNADANDEVSANACATLVDNAHAADADDIHSDNADANDEVSANACVTHFDNAHMPDADPACAVHADSADADTAAIADASSPADPGARARGMYLKRFWTRWLEARAQAEPELTGFNQAAQDGRVAAFGQLDDLQLMIARARLKQSLCEKLPGTGYAVHAGDEYAVLMRELGKRQRHMPLRKLFGAIPNLLLRLKPCLMMSPLSVSYFLEAETYRFDLVIFDEASQILPQDAIGAIARGAQVIIAGDPMQLPPTRFFAASLDTADADGEGEDDEPLYSSILECAGAALPRCMLRWHYRSRHEHLIAFSNAQIYSGGLITFPGARQKQRDTGVEYVYVEDGIYEGQGVNQTEARRCVQLVHRHILTCPERSLGVIAFSQKQQAAIEYALERFRLSHPELEWFFGESDRDGARRDEPFFIKNLENVQGDERDTIIFSIGYGRNRQGRMYMRFGPLSSEGGERRLNVAITRARHNVKLVGSILPGDIDLARTASVGARMLRDYIEFALNGTLPASAQPAAAAAPDGFADYIAGALARAGYRVARRVGCSAYKVDIALEHPDAPGAYFAGIECDGPMYMTARTVRERDQLRAHVLEGMGWRLMRVWSQQFLRDPNGQMEQLLAFAHNALETFTPDAPAPEPDAPLWDEEELTRAVEPEREPEGGLGRYGIRQYATARWSDAPVSEGATPEARLRACLMYVISVEQPLHMELLQRRLAGFFGNEKVTPSVRRAIDEALHPLLGAGVERTEDGFLYLMPRPPICARTPAPGEAPRRIEHIAPEEISSAMRGIIAGTFGITPEALMSETVRALGYDRSGPRIAAALERAYAQLLAGGRACLLDGKLTLTGGE